MLVERTILGSYRVQVHGLVLPDKRVSLQETKVLHEPFPGDWALDSSAGLLSKDGLTLSVVGIDTRGSTSSWTFKLRSTQPFIPKD